MLLQSRSLAKVASLNGDLRHRPVKGANLNHREAIDRRQQLIGYSFENLDLIRMALTHASAADSRLCSNERLEFLGDSVLGLVVCDELFQRYPEYLEGELTKLKSVVVSRKICAKIADNVGLTPMMVLGKGMESRENVPTSVRAAVFESVIGAIFLDGGFEAARDFILVQIDRFIEETNNSEHHFNHKSLLQQLSQKQFSQTPHYEQLDEKGPDHSKCFEICVSVGQRRFPAAWGANKKEAEQKAALNALEEISQENEASLDHPLDPTEADSQNTTPA